MPSGYSGKSLVDKLGIKAGFRIAILNAPETFGKTLGPLPPGVRELRATASRLDYVHLFSTSSLNLRKKLPPLRRIIAEDGMVWVSWPKTSSRLTSDLNENVVRSIGLASGMVDVKVCAIDEDWSGLKFVIRLKDRRPGRDGAGKTSR